MKWMPVASAGIPPLTGRNQWTARRISVKDVVQQLPDPPSASYPPFLFYFLNWISSFSYKWRGRRVLGRVIYFTPAFYCWTFRPYVWTIFVVLPFVVGLLYLVTGPQDLRPSKLTSIHFPGTWTRWNQLFLFLLLLVGNIFFFFSFYMRKIVVISVCAINAIVRPGVYDLAGNRFTICPRRIFFFFFFPGEEEEAGPRAREWWWRGSNNNNNNIIGGCACKIAQGFIFGRLVELERWCGKIYERLCFFWLRHPPFW